MFLVILGYYEVLNTFSEHIPRFLINYYTHLG